MSVDRDGLSDSSYIAEHRQPDNSAPPTARMPRMDTRRPLDQSAVGMMLLLCLIWSLQQIGLKATAEEFSPVLQIAVRSGIASVLVLAIVLLRGERISVGQGIWRAGLLSGVLFSLEYLLVGEALRHTSAGHVVVFLYTSPVFAALGLHWKLPSERLAPLQWLGIALAFGGIAMAFLGGSAQPGQANRLLWGDFLALLGGAAWGATTVLIRGSRLSNLPASQTLLYQLLCAFALLLPAALLTGHTHFEPIPKVWASLAFQSVVMCVLSLLAWFALLRRYLASQLGVFTFLTPLFGVLLGAWLLGEPIEAGFLRGALLVLLGIGLVSGHAWLGQRLQRSRSAGRHAERTEARAPR